MKTFVICCVIFLVVAWICLAIEHGEAIGDEIITTFKKIFGEEDKGK